MTADYLHFVQGLTLLVVAANARGFALFCLFTGLAAWTCLVVPFSGSSPLVPAARALFLGLALLTALLALRRRPDAEEPEPLPHRLLLGLLAALAWLAPALSLLCSGGECPLPAAAVSVLAALGLALAVRASTDTGPRLGPIAASLLVATLALGWLTSTWYAGQVDEDLRRQIRRRATTIARAVSPDRVAELSFTPADRDHPAFLTLRTQLQAVARFAGHRLLYSMARRNGRILFGPENLAEDDPLASPPGTPYEQPPAAVNEAFDHRVSQVEGPYTDEYGTFVSAFAPVVDRTSGEVVLVVGVDIPGGDWTRTLRTARLLPLPFVAALCLLTLLGTHLPRGGRPEAALAAAVGLVLTLGAVLVAHDTEDRARLIRFEQLADSEAAHVVTALVAIRDYRITSLARFFRASTFVDEAEFAIFAGPLADSLGVDALLYTTAAVSPEGALTSCRVRYVAPDDECDEWRDRDLAADDDVRRALTAALDAGLPRAGPPREDAEHGAPLAMLLALPVTRAGALQGFAAAELRPDRLLVHALSQAEVEGDLSDVTLLLASPEAPPLTLASTRPAGSPPLVAPGQLTGHPVFAFGEAFIVLVEPGAAFTAAHTGRAEVLVFLVGLLLTAALTVLVGALAGRRQRLEAQVRLRTAELDASRERFAQVTEVAGEVIWEVDARGIYTFVSRACKAVYGRTEDEIVGRLHFYDMAPPEDREGLAELGRMAFEQGKPHKDAFFKIVRPDGSIVELLSSGTPIFGDDGTVRGVRGSDRDITAQRRAEEALREEALRSAALAGRRQALEEQVRLRTAELHESRERFAQVAEMTGEVIWEVDAQGLYTFVSRACEAVYGFTEDETVGKLHFYDLAPPNDQESLKTAALAAFESRVTLTDFPNRVVRKDGEVIEVLTNGAPVLNEDGSLRGYRGSDRDITARRRAEEELREATRRSAALADQAEAASRAKSEFLATMSHEIRTPLNGVIGMTGLLLDSPLDDQQRRWGEIIRTSGESLLAIINDVLDFSKIEAGRLELELLDFDLHVTLEDVAESLALRAHSRGVELVLSVAPDVPSRVRGDPGRLRQILLNLGGNAVKFTEQGSITIRASVSEAAADGFVLRVEVEDTGIGVPEDRARLLFTPFTQADGSITRRYGGSGLGLAISKRLVELMEGSIGLQSQEGQGATFWFTVTLVEQPIGASCPLPRPADLTGLRVLTVDDLAANRLLTTTLLRSWGCRPAEADGGPTALAALRAAVTEGDPFAAVLLDRCMPDGDGLELGLTIQGDESCGSPRLILMTSLGQRGDAARMTEAGFAGFLTKPVRASNLRDCICLVLGRKTAGDAPAPLVTRHVVAEAQRHKARILLAEDNAVNRLLAVTLLEKLGHRADSVADGREALEALRTTPYDLVVMDCQMPEMDGYEATRRIRAGEAGQAAAALPIVALTAHALKGDRELCLEAGMDDYLTKPLRMDELATALNRWLSEGSAPEPSPASSSSSASSSPVFDQPAFDERTMNDAEVAAAVLEAFLEDTPKQLEELRRVVADDDRDGVRALAHRLKGSAGSCGGVAMQAAALVLEKAAADEGSDLRPLVADLESCYDELLPHLRPYLD